ncbi:MAG: RNA polymerase sigma factor [Desulfovibrionales bacterium]
MTPERESSIIKAVLSGDSEAYGLLVEQFQRPIYNLMFRTTRSPEDAADLTQETFIKGFEKLGTFKTGKSFFSWIYAIGINHSRDFLRRNTRAVPMNNDSADMPTEDPRALQEFGRALDSLVLEQALGQLDLLYREAVILRYKEERSMDEIAEILGLTPSGAKMRVYRGLDQLRNIMQEGANARGKN